MDKTFVDCLNGILGVAYQAGLSTLILTTPTNIAFAVACRYKRSLNQENWN
jgi:hypothetical protein